MKQRLVNYAALIISTVVLLLPAIYNHYPMMDPDAGTYIASGFKLETPFDRPITYGLLVRLFSLNGLSLWLVIAAQAFIVSWLVWRLYRLVVSPDKAYLYSALTILFLSLATSLSWLVCMIHPDIFTSVACLCIILIYAGDRYKSLLYVLFWVSAAVHLSHPVLLTGLVLVLLLSRRLYMPAFIRRRHTVQSAVLVVLSLSAIVVMGSAISKSKHVFFTGTLVEKGVLKVYLDEQCDKKNYQLCAYKDQLPKTSDEFVWVSSSPLYKVGDWAGSKKEFNEIDKDVLATPRYLSMFLKGAVLQFGRQAASFDIGTGTFSFKAGSNVHNQLTTWLPAAVPAFDAAVQNNTNLPVQLERVNTVLRFVIYLSLVVLLGAFIRWRRLSQPLRLILIVLVAGCVINCADFATLSVVVGRYGAKMIWLLPLSAVLASVQLVSSSKRMFR